MQNLFTIALRIVLFVLYFFVSNVCSHFFQALRSALIAVRERRCARIIIIANSSDTWIYRLKGFVCLKPFPAIRHDGLMFSLCY